jgi:metallo-beta-lactamase family protein
MAKAKNKKGHVRVSFVGKNSDDVTGSCTLVQSETHKILLECGLYQSCEPVLHDYRINNESFGFKSKEIDYVFVGHCHIDHIGRIPLLFARGFTGRVIAPVGTKQLAEILLRDSAFIMKRDAEYITEATGRYNSPIYTEADVDACLENWDEYPLNERIKLDDELTFQFRDSGHIINSAQIEIWLRDTPSGKFRKIAYTSDLGNRNTPDFFTSPSYSIKTADLLIGECTYSDKNIKAKKSDREKDLERIKTAVEDFCMQEHGRILIPVFANDRCQNIIVSLFEIFGSDDTFNIPIVIDSPMACNISELYRDLCPEKSREKYEQALCWKNLHFVRDYEESKALQDSKSPMIILASSGFLTAGRSVAWAKKIIPSNKNCIMFCGYAHPKSLAGKLKNEHRGMISVSGKSVPNRCNVVVLSSFSSHMQYDDLMSYYSHINSPKIALVHGDFKQKCEFTKELQEEIHKNNRTGRVICVNKNTEITL